MAIGGREKAPAAFCRKALNPTDKFEMWGDGKQTRSFTFIDECVEGALSRDVNRANPFGFGPAHSGHRAIWVWAIRVMDFSGHKFSALTLTRRVLG